MSSTAPSVPAEIRARAALPRRERVLAACAAGDGAWLLGTRDALVVVPAGLADSAGPAGEVSRLPWEQVASADWSRDDERLRVVGVGEYGRPQPVHVFSLLDPGPLLGLLRERVTASIVLQRRVSLGRRQGMTVIARRPPGGTGAVTWAYELDPGLDPEDPEVRRLAEAGLRAAAEEIGQA